jgi:hypothetical protein
MMDDFSYVDLKITDEFVKALSEYIEPSGAVSIHKNPSNGSTDNPILFTATALNLMHERRTRDAAMDTNVMAYLSNCEVKPGLYNRYPWDNHYSSGHLVGLPLSPLDRKKNRLISHDEIIGLVRSFEYLGRETSKRILAYGEKHSWSYNNQEPDKWSFRSWLWRFGIFVPYLKITAGKMPTFLERVFYAVSLLLVNLDNKSKTSTRCLIAIQKHSMRSGIKAKY